MGRISVSMNWRTVLRIRSWSLLSEKSIGKFVKTMLAHASRNPKSCRQPVSWVRARLFGWRIRFGRRLQTLVGGGFMPGLHLHALSLGHQALRVESDVIGSGFQIFETILAGSVGGGAGGNFSVFAEQGHFRAAQW